MWIYSTSFIFFNKLYTEGHTLIHGYQQKRESTDPIQSNSDGMILDWNVGLVLDWILHIWMGFMR